MALAILGFCSVLLNPGPVHTNVAPTVPSPLNLMVEPIQTVLFSTLALAVGLLLTIKITSLRFASGVSQNAPVVDLQLA